MSICAALCSLRQDSVYMLLTLRTCVGQSVYFVSLCCPLFTVLRTSQTANMTSSTSPSPRFDKSCHVYMCVYVFLPVCAGVHMYVWVHAFMCACVVHASMASCDGRCPVPSLVRTMTDPLPTVTSRPKER